MKRDTIVQIAKMYYFDNMSQQEIANELGISRSNVSRLLRIAKEMNIVNIQINDVSVRALSVAESIKDMFGLHHVIIAPSHNELEINTSNIGYYAAKYLESIVRDNLKIGVTWGSSVFHLALNLSPVENINMEVVQMMGGVSWSDSYKYGVRLMFEFAERIGGSARLLNAPLVVQDKKLHDQLMKEAGIKVHMEVIRQCDVALLGIGTNKQEYSTMVMANAILAEESDRLWEKGVIAHLCGRPLDENGAECKGDLDDKIISVKLDDLKLIPEVIAVAGGNFKVKPIIAALRSGFINTLVTDEKTALSVIKYAAEK
jgi:DNA-binding transcriptional regulator LsrR (DeoR family)